MTKLSTAQKVFKNLLGAFLIVAGISHFVMREEFINLVPMWLPIDYDLVVLISGGIEIILGSLIIAIPKKSVALGWTVAAYFVLIFPGNVTQYTNETNALGLNTDSLRLYRLFLQPVLIAWALWATNAWDNLIHKQGNWHIEESHKSRSNDRKSSNSDHAKAS